MKFECRKFCIFFVGKPISTCKSLKFNMESDLFPITPSLIYNPGVILYIWYYYFDT